MSHAKDKWNTPAKYMTKRSLKRGSSRQWRQISF